MDIAVTGSTGLIGTALCRRLEADGDRVIRVVRRRVAADEAAIRWDPAAGIIDAASLEGVGAVVHLAGAGIGDKRWSVERKREILESRTKGTALLAATLAGLERKPDVLVSGSAIGFYGDRGDEVLTEQSEPGNDFLAEICTAWEAEARPAADAGIRVATIRTGVVLSRDGGALAKLLPLFKVGAGGKFGSGRQWWSWISLDDEIAAIRHLIDHPVSGPVNLTAPNPETNAAFTKVLGRVLGRPSFLAVPAFGPKLLVGGELAEALLFTSAKVLPEALESSGFTFAHPDLESALRSVLGKEKTT
ncbi:MAG TPA: TIGR01777 family oxidoreductase [Acidimicrobiales bacterium]